MRGPRCCEKKVPWKSTLVITGLKISQLLFRLLCQHTHRGDAGEGGWKLGFWLSWVTLCSPAPDSFFTLVPGQRFERPRVNVVVQGGRLNDGSF